MGIGKFSRLAAAAAFVAFVPVSALPALACGDKISHPAKAIPADATKVVIGVEGMHCGDCANSIRNAVVALAGVYDAQVDFTKGQATVQFDGKTTSVEAISAAIDKAGYKAGKVDRPGA